MKSLPNTNIPNPDPIDTILYAMDKGVLEMWIKAWVNKNNKLEVTLHSTYIFSERKDFAFLLMDIAMVLMEDDWEKVGEICLSCQPCADHLRKYDILPKVCSDCGRGSEYYAKKTTDR